jgi:hypothetical protein
MTCDFIALVLQALGGAIADTAGTENVSDIGTHTMVGGLAFQVLSLLLFIGLAVEFALNVRRDRRTGRFQKQPREHVRFNGKSEGVFKMFLFGILHLVQSTVSSTLADSDS